MKFLLKTVLIICCTSVLIFFAVHFYFSTHERKDEIVEIVLAHDKGIIPLFQNSFALQGEAAKKALGTGFVPASSQTTGLFVSQMMAALPTDEAPELFTWWSSARVRPLVDKSLVDDLTFLWDKYKNEYDSVIRDAYTFEGKVYGFPYSIEYWAIWYNKKIFSRLNLEEPQTFAEFMTICETLKANGIPPLLSSLQDEWYSFVWFIQMLIGEDPDFYFDLCEGRASYLDPRAKKAMTMWGDMIKKGYFTDPGVNMFTNGGHLWNREEFAMVLCGSWYYSTVLVPQGVDEENIGVFILPSHNKNAGKNIIMESGPIFTATNAPRNKEALKIADWWMGSEGNAHFSRVFESYAPNRKTDQNYLPLVKQSLLTQVIDKKYRILNRYWEATPAPVVEFAVEKFGEFTLNPHAAVRVLTQIEGMAQDYFAAHPLHNQATKKQGEQKQGPRE